jgi:adenylyltransferase/sulfurtransferase
MMQFTPQREMEVSLEFLKGKLEKVGDVSYLGSILQFRVDKYEMMVFPDGRAFIKGTTDKKIAKSLYTKYIGV